MARKSLSNRPGEIQAARRGAAFASLLAASLFAAQPVVAAPLYVLASNDPAAAPIGAELDTGKVTLPAGAVIEVMSETGDVFELAGPLDGPVDPATEVDVASPGGLLTGGGIKVAPATSFFIAGSESDQPASAAAPAAKSAHFHNDKAKSAPARSADGIVIIE